VQNQAAADDDLESAFQEASTSIPRKKTREELIKELKEARSSAPVAHAPQDGLERAKMAGKFKPIGAPDKPVEKEKTKRKKRAKDGADDGKRKKKRKIDSEPAEAQRNEAVNDKTLEKNLSGGTPSEVTEATRLVPTTQKALTPLPLNDDDDIFADAGEYKGLEISDDDSGGDNEEERPKTLSKPSGCDPSSASSPNNKPIRNWFGEPVQSDQPPVSLKPSSIAPAPVVSLSATSREPQSRREEHGDDLIEGAKLRGLASSAVPSIKDLLAIDEAAEREEKRRARKEKKKAKKLGEEAKLDREVKKYALFITLETEALTSRTG
jgi:IK cytokine